MLKGGRGADRVEEPRTPDATPGGAEAEAEVEAEDGVVTTAALHASSAGCTQRPSAAGAHEVVKYSLAVERGVTRSAYAADRAGVEDTEWDSPRLRAAARPCAAAVAARSRSRRRVKSSAMKRNTLREVSRKSENPVCSHSQRTIALVF